MRGHDTDWSEMPSPGNAEPQDGEMHSLSDAWRSLYGTKDRGWSGALPQSGVEAWASVRGCHRYSQAADKGQTATPNGSAQFGGSARAFQTIVPPRTRRRGYPTRVPGGVFFWHRE
jgi:hypothetical protein